MVLFSLAIGAALAAQARLPNDPLTLRAFTLRFDQAGTFSLAGKGWPTMQGTWAESGNEVTLQMPAAEAEGCRGQGRYTFTLNGSSVSFAVVSDGCTERRMILDRNTWVPPGTALA